tara:strand:- start:2947 stop:4743 length:1797 start_codon:yes stop_codon:yes gene_type:complete
MKYKIFLLSSIFFTSISFAQELDPSFLESLPGDIQKDFLDRTLADKEEEKYSNPNTRIKNLETALRQAEQSLQRIKVEIDADKGINNRALKRFGESYFNSFQSSFLPINEPNFNADYILDVGDQISLQLIGQRSDDFDMNIKRDGSINVDEIGKFFIAGLSLQAASELIKETLSESLPGTQAFISINEVRDINVFVVGSVNNPGMYTLPGGSNILSVINAAGGITAEGSYRSIIHKRANEVHRIVDLYEVFINGNLSNLGQLRSGDVLLINPSISDIRISGGIALPGIYELKEDETIDDIFRFSGLRARQVNEINIERISNGRYEGINLNLSDATGMKIFDGDSIEIPYVDPKFNQAKTISISGAVKIPGTYVVADKTRLSDVLKMAGSYNDEAYPLGGVFLRETVKEMEKEFRERGYNELIQFIASAQNAATSSLNGESLITVLALLRDYEPVGRIVTEFELSKLESNPSLDRILEDGDSIHIPSFSNQVYIFGDVINPSSIAFKSNMSVNDYIKAVGGFGRFADQNRVIVTYPNGNSYSYRPNIFSSFGNDEVLPGTVIYVPRHIGKIDGVSFAAVVAPIISSFALSVASLNTINN